MQITLTMKVVDTVDGMTSEDVMDAIIDEWDNTTVDVEWEDDDGNGSVTTVTLQEFMPA